MKTTKQLTNTPSIAKKGGDPRGEFHSNGLWRIPGVGGHALRHVTAANRYLRHQQLRLFKKLAQGNGREALHIFTSLMVNSRSLQVFYFHSVTKNWYIELSKAEVLRKFNLFRRELKYGGVNFIITRVYIPKPNKKLRPLGVPAIQFRIINAAFSDFLYGMLGDKISSRQYGFMPGKDVYKAGEFIWNNTKKRTKIFEFDLEAFFNNIDRNKLYSILEEYKVPKELIHYIRLVNLTVPRVFIDDIQPEKEVIVYKDVDSDSLHNLEKRGLPQGLPGSPFLSILLLDHMWKVLKINPIMFADDGLLLYNGKLDTSHGEEIMIKYGVKFSYKLNSINKVSTGTAGNLIKFLGLTWDRSTDSVYHQTIFGPRGILGKYYIKKGVGKSYNKSEGLKGIVHKDSYIYEQHSIGNYGRFVMDYFMDRKARYHFQDGRLYDITKSSSLCSEELLCDVRHFPVQSNCFLGKFSNVTYLEIMETTENVDAFLSYHAKLGDIFRNGDSFGKIGKVIRKCFERDVNTKILNKYIYNPNTKVVQK